MSGGAPDDWESNADDVAAGGGRGEDKKQGQGLKADAPAFSFNPGASSFSFVPGGGFTPSFQPAMMMRPSNVVVPPQAPAPEAPAPVVRLPTPSERRAAAAAKAAAEAEAAAAAAAAENPGAGDGESPMETDGEGVAGPSEGGGVGGGDGNGVAEIEKEVGAMSVEDKRDAALAALAGGGDLGGRGAGGGGEEAVGGLSKSKSKEEMRAAREARKAELLAAAEPPPPPPVTDDEDKREHVNLVFIGHVDARKSTIGGSILFHTGAVDERTIQKFEREAKEKNRDSWYMAYIMDVNEEERAKGKTVEVGRAQFQTEAKRYTILDAPGHKNYVPNMISGASQADVAVLVLAARKGEFETGFEKGGQTREHAQLAKVLGVSKLVCLINKMDDHSVKWSEERYNTIVTKITPFLKKCGYNVAKDVYFIPISGLKGQNMKDHVGADAPWYTGPTFFQLLDGMERVPRDFKAPTRMPIIDKFREMGTIVMGKLEQGTLYPGQKLMLLPNKVPVTVSTLFLDAKEDEKYEVKVCRPGENVKVRIDGVEESEIQGGCVLSSVERPARVVNKFECQIVILELLEHKSVFTAGYKAVLHLHTTVEECEVVMLRKEVDMKTKKEKKNPKFLRTGSIGSVVLQTDRTVAIDTFANCPSLGRFTLRDEGRTIAIGKVLRVPDFDYSNIS